MTNINFVFNGILRKFEFICRNLVHRQLRTNLLSALRNLIEQDVYNSAMAIACCKMKSSVANSVNRIDFTFVIYHYFDYFRVTHFSSDMKRSLKGSIANISICVFSKQNLYNFKMAILGC